MWRSICVSLLLLVLLATSASAQAPDRLPVPTGETLDKARQAVAEIYKKQWDSAKTMPQRMELARTLFDEAGKTRDDPAARYALLLAAQQLATLIGNSHLTCNIIDTQAHHYAIDPLATKVDVLEKVLANIKLERDYYFFTQQVDQLLPELIKKDHWDTARKVVSLAEVAARKARDTDLARVYADRSEDLTAQQKATEKLNVTLTELEVSPGDGIANESAGKMVSFALGDWSRGLPMLALSNDKELQALAERDLRASSNADKLDLADSWTKYAATREGLAKRNIQRHALELYMQVQPTLSGLNRTRIDQEVRQLFREAMPDRVPLALLKPKRYSVHNPAQGPHMVGEVAGYKFPNSVWAHPPEPNTTSVIEYDLPCEFKYLIGFCAIHTNVKPDTAAVFRVCGHGVGNLFRIKEPLGTPNTFVPFRADLRGLKDMHLAVDCHGGHGQVWTIFVTPMLQK